MADRGMFAGIGDALGIIRKELPQWWVDVNRGRYMRPVEGLMAPAGMMEMDKEVTPADVAEFAANFAMNPTMSALTYTPEAEAAKKGGASGGLTGKVGKAVERKVGMMAKIEELLAAAKKAGAPKEVLDEAVRRTKELQTQARIQVPKGDQYWPWRAEPGGFAPTFDPDKNRWFNSRVHSDDEKALTKAIAKAQAEVKAGKGVTPIYDLNNLRYPPMRNQTLPVPQHVNGRPDWVNRDLNDAAAKRWDELASRAAPGAKDWFKTGEMWERMVPIYGKEGATREMDRLAAMAGATTSDARPNANFRNASYHWVRDAQGIPPQAEPPYPYGHKRHASTYMPALQQLQGASHLDPMTQTKGAHFAGNLSGQTGDATIDKVVANNLPLRNAGGTKVLDAPAPNTYGYVREFFSDGIKTRPKYDYPMEWQAEGWGGSNADAVEDYSKPALGHFSDRINVTSKVTGLPAKEVEQLFYRKIIPLLSVGGLGMMGLQEPFILGNQVPQGR